MDWWYLSWLRWSLQIYITQTTYGKALCNRSQGGFLEVTEVFRSRSKWGCHDLRHLLLLYVLRAGITYRPIPAPRHFVVYINDIDTSLKNVSVEIHRILMISSCTMTWKALILHAIDVSCYQTRIQYSNGLFTGNSS